MELDVSSKGSSRGIRGQGGEKRTCALGKNELNINIHF